MSYFPPATYIAWHIAWLRVLPTIMALLIVLATLARSLGILAEASLSFLGLGIQPPDRFGSNVEPGHKFMELSPGLAIFPGSAIMVIMLYLGMTIK